MADRDVARRARAYAKELRDGREQAPAGEYAPEVPRFLRDRSASSTPKPRSGELWMAFPHGAGIPTPVALVQAAPLVVVPMTREVWLADAYDPLVPPESSPTGEWLAALMPGATTTHLEALRRPVGGLPEPVVALLKRLVENPNLARHAQGPVPIEGESDVPLPSHATTWATADGENLAWLAGTPIPEGDPRAEARRLHLDAVSWLGDPAPASAPTMLERLRAALSAWADVVTDGSWLEAPAIGGIVLGAGSDLVMRAAESVARRGAPIEGACRLGDVLVEVSFEPASHQLRMTLVASRDGRPASGVRVRWRHQRADRRHEEIERVTGGEGLVTGLILPLEEGISHELAVEADGHRRILSF